MTVIEEIQAELGRATAKFPTWPTDPLHALAVLGDNVWGNRVTYSLYTFGEKKASAIKKEIEKAILKKGEILIAHKRDRTDHVTTTGRLAERRKPCSTG